MKTPEPILVAHLFPELRHHLLELLESLTDKEWSLPTAARLWTVKDTALHLLGGDMGILSRKRDAFTPSGRSLEKWEDLVAFINELNHTWLQATRRLSTRVLIDLLAYTGPQVEAYFSGLDPYALGDPVSWTGPNPAPAWLDLAREYTERWHHQQQIRDAASRPGLYVPHLFAPVLDAFVRALPHTFRDVKATDGTIVQLTIEGSAGNQWCLRRASNFWELLVGASKQAVSDVRLASEDAWKIFTRGYRGSEAIKRARIRGDQNLGLKILETVSVIA
jgi:uncharacterized protein (TIGR03083 family)